MHNCHVCESQIDNKNILQLFCSDNCQKQYWDNPTKVTITTICPTCNKPWDRTIYSVELFAYQSLTMCPECEQTYGQ